MGKPGRFYMVKRTESDWFLEQLQKEPLSAVGELSARLDGATILADTLSNKGGDEGRGSLMRSVCKDSEVRKALRDRVESDVGEDTARFLNHVYHLIGGNRLWPIYWVASVGILGAVGLAVRNVVGNSTLTGWAVAVAIVSSIVLTFLLLPSFAVCRFFDAILGKRRQRQEWVRNLRVVAVVYPLLLVSLPWFARVGNASGKIPPAATATPTSAGAPWGHQSFPPISFDCPSYMAVPEKKDFDVEKVRDTLRPSGVEILVILMSADMDTTIQLAKTKRDISMSSLYEEKKSLADEINEGGRNVMGEDYTKLTIERARVAGDVQALSEHGEKANGEVAEVVEFLNEGYDYSMMFIYKNGNLARSDSTARERIVQSIRLVGNPN
jgi:hypothetical protein